MRASTSHGHDAIPRVSWKVSARGENSAREKVTREKYPVCGGMIYCEACNPHVDKSDSGSVCRRAPTFAPQQGMLVLRHVRHQVDAGKGDFGDLSIDMACSDNSWLFGGLGPTTRTGTFHAADAGIESGYPKGTPNFGAGRSAGRKR